MLERVTVMQIEIPFSIIELEQDNAHIVVESKTGRKKIRWIRDTGASKTVFDINQSQYYRPKAKINDEEYKTFGIGTKEIETSIGVIDTVRFGKFVIKNLDVALINMEPVNEIYRKFGHTRVDGLLGSDIMRRYRCKINFAENVITFETRLSGVG